ncbi:uncharacterized protein LY89DRAFT_778796 [Mollisia scopiformis]|uniref:Uncharacterized protein n=1 Tax=Mollisia scopiformis TaxID=149040 RepID=A0A194XN35_MOLSC|nr:uncharacterized protein LY89DRAFT_778796 [Mollisia scopiformis]KUJ21187.1 hypothetical protein LY89DRAFT_778796 [Mollisia scopiformis]
MPTHLGIQFEVLSQLELAIHPEFPHPESSQSTHRSPKRVSSVVDWSPPAVSAVSKADALLGRNTTCSVYIPSTAGARFWLRYNIDKSALANSKWYYFKLFMNGRHIASFGVDAKKKPSGQVMHGLFDPSSDWNYENNGEIWKNMGLEKRAFYFAGADKQRSVINDGGLIEVLCFRAQGRRRKLPDPEVWRDQQDYGIITPGEGLHENPAEAKFYDWHLKDANKSPFVVFKFHYRSWESLEMLELIPSDHPRILMQPQRKLLPEELKAMLEVQSQDLTFLNRPHPPCEDCVPSLPAFAGDSWFDDTEDMEDFADFDSTPQAPKHTGGEFSFEAEVEVSPLRIRRRRPTAPSSKFSDSKLRGTTSPAGSPRPREIRQGALDDFLNRPLPEIPLRKSSKKLHSRSSSTTSRAPSVTPSLLPYIDRDSVSPEPEVGVAQMVEVLLASPVQVPSLNSDSDPMEASDLIITPPKISAFEKTSPLPIIEESSPMLPRKPLLSNLLPSGMSNVIKRKPVGSPSAFFKQEETTTPSPTDLYPSSSLPNVTVRRPRRSTFMKLPLPLPMPRSKTAVSFPKRKESVDVLRTQEVAAVRVSESLSESEWMSRTPLPHSSMLSLESLGGATPNSTLAKRMIAEKASSLGSAIKRKSTSWYKHKTQARTDSLNENTPDNSSLASDSNIRVDGNWI